MQESKIDIPNTSSLLRLINTLYKCFRDIAFKKMGLFL